MKRHLATLALAVVLTLVAGAALAYWSAGSAPGGNGAAAATSVNQGATPTANATGSTVTVSWTATSLANGQAVSGYLVKRYDAGTQAAQTILSACTGTVATTSCVESNVPNGSWKYTVTPVFATNWQGLESAKSTTVTVSSDATPPTNAITLSSVTGGAYLTGTTVYYRGAAAGSLRLTNAVTDAGSGPASSSTAALTGTSTGWSHTASTVSTPAGGPYVSNPFAWTAGTTTGPGEAVTGRDVAGNTAVTNLTFADDSTAPTAGTITYADGFTSGRSASITFTSGTDAGAGIATRRLQRAVATLTGTTCATFGSFTDIGADSPASPYVDGSLQHGCYRYRYVVTDRVGNQDIATSANVVKVSYSGAVNATAGLLSHWRLGEAAATLTSTDSFTGTSGSALTSHAGELGATWAHQAGGANAQITDANRIRRSDAGLLQPDYTIDYTTATPPSADYSVEADLVVKSNMGGDMVGVIGRHNTATNTFYMARWEQSDTSWNLVKYTNGTVSYLSFLRFQPALVVNEAYRIRLEMTGTALNLYVNGVLKVTATDATITAAGKAGIMDGDNGGSALAADKTNTTGIHLDNFQVTPSTYPRAADNKGTNTGDYENGVTLGAPGALSAGTNTAATFDGVNDYVQMTNTTGFPTAASVRSTELWFKTSSSARQVLFRYGTGANTQEYGLWIDAGGATMTAWGFGGGNDKIFTMPSAVNNGAWHQVVETYNGSSITLYIDGVALPAQAATRATAMDMYGFGIGAIIRPSDGNSGGFFSGSIDEVSFYTTVLTQAQVTDHYQLAGATSLDLTGPTGGSVDATGLVGTGSRYSTSTTLSLALAKGTDPSGVATTGNQVLRATATLTNGTCGTFGSYTLVTGGTDPSSPLADTAADQACYSYQYVVLDTLGNATTYTSPDIKVDTTAPSAPALAFSASTNTYWSGSGSTVYYRSAAASGSVTTTATTSDAASGILSYAFPALGTNWTSTPGALGVNTYSWSGAPAAPGTKNVTATNNAAAVSANAPLTLTADDTAPTAGTVTYTDGNTSSTSIPVTFTTGTDAGSGIASRLLQRASATLTGTTCGSFGAFATVSGGTDPTSPFTDTGVRGTCYQYQYVVADNLGNQHVATSGNVVKVLPTYLTSVNGTSGLVNYYRMGEATTSADSMTGTSGATLQSRNGETAAIWTKHPVSSGDAVLTPAGRVRKAGTNLGALYYASGAPASADYTVEADVFVASVVTDDMAGVVGRVDVANTNGTYYYFRYEQANSVWVLFRVVNGTWTWLGQSGTQTLTAGATYRAALDLTGTSIRGLVDGVPVVSVTDATITAAGRGGIALGFHGSTSTTLSDATGFHLDNFRISPPLTDSKGTNHGDYLGGVALGGTGAIAGDASTSAAFDGVNDFSSIGRQVSDDFSIEVWFKSTQGIGNGTQWWSGAGLVDGEVSGAFNDFGVSLRADGRVLAGIGTPDVSIVSTAGGYNNGAWHQVVFTRTKATGTLALYVDGVPAGTATGASTASLTGPSYLSFGRIQAGNNYLLGSLDEISIYNTVLSAATISAHYTAGQ